MSEEAQALIELLDAAEPEGSPAAALRRRVPRAVGLGLRALAPLPDELCARLAGELVEWLRAVPEALAARALESLGKDAAASGGAALLAAIGDALEGALGDEDEELRRCCVSAVAALAPPGCLRMLRAAAADPSEAVAARAAACLAEKGELDAALRLASGKGDGPARALSLLALRHAKGDARAAEAVLAGLRGPGQLAKVAAMRAAAALGLLEALPLLCAALFSVSEDERREAIRALATLGGFAAPGSPGGAAALAALQGAAKDDTLAVLRAAAALGAAELAGGRDALLLALAADGDAEVRALAVAGLGRSGGSAALVPLLEALADESPEVCAAAAAALGKSRAAAAAVPLEALLDDQDDQVARAAALALARVAPARAAEVLAPLLSSDDAQARSNALVALWDAELEADDGLDRARADRP